MSVPRFLAGAGIAGLKMLIHGCPAPPDWLRGTLVRLLKFGLALLDSLGRPKAFYSKLIHDQCPRFADYEREKFARAFADEGCLFKLGCLGPITRADGTVRHWNGGINTCIKAGRLASAAPANNSWPGPTFRCIRERSRLDRAGRDIALQRPRPRSSGRNGSAQNATLSPDCAAARGADGAARRPYQVQGFGARSFLLGNSLPALVKLKP